MIANVMNSRLDFGTTVAPYRGMKTIYEWDIETVDTHGDILDHDHRDALAEYTADELHAALTQTREPDGSFTRLVLVRSTFDARGSLDDRTWAYVDVAPFYFRDASDNRAQAVPERFVAELAERRA